MSDTNDPTERDPFGADRTSGADDRSSTGAGHAAVPREDFDTAVFGAPDAAAPRTEPIRAVDEGHLTAAPHAAPAVAVATAEPERSRRRGLLVPVVVAAVLAALIGGVIGAASTLALAPRTVDASAGGTGSGGAIRITNPATATAISAVAAKASPSVVTISVTEAGGQEAGTGSGVVLTSDGDVLTNTHVVTLDGASSNVTITATTSGGRIYQAKTVGTDPTNDLAVIKLTDASGLQPATFADSSKLDVGDAAIAIGAPLGLSNTVTSGIVSALNRSISVQSSAVPDDGSDSGDGSEGTSPFGFPDQGGTGGAQTASSDVYLSVVQTDTAINPGNSGGALLDDKGEVIGVNVAIAGTSQDSTSTTQSGNIGVGFAIPSNIAHRIGLELMKGEKATHGLLGVTPADPTSTSTRSGATVSALTSGGAAANAGLRQGDVITAFNGIAIAGREDLTAQVRALPGGTSTTITYQRDGTSHTVQVKLGTFKG